MFLENFRCDWDGGVYRIGNDADHGLRPMPSTGSHQGGNSCGTGVAQVIPCHAWLSRHSSWSNHQITTVQAVWQLLRSEVALQSRSGLRGSDLQHSGV